MMLSVSTNDHDILLHVGLPKTGTTSIQIHLRDNPEALARAGWRYAAAGRGSPTSTSSSSMRLGSTAVIGVATAVVRCAKSLPRNVPLMVP